MVSRTSRLLLLPLFDVAICEIIAVLRFLEMYLIMNIAAAIGLAMTGSIH